ncbi:MAG: hypothetical protein KDA61_12765, partial [Planctomycetales bacterium]|nr:hypothetical protein [Planctomycetales bacterium]
DVDERTDVYSLGVVAFELLAGKLPYETNRLTEFQLRRTIAETQPANLNTYRNRLVDLSRLEVNDLQIVIAGALEKDRRKRYQRPADLAADLRRVLSGEPILRRRATTAYRLVMFANRNRALAASLVGILFALMVGLATSTTLYLKLNQKYVDVESRNAELSANRGDWRSSLAAIGHALQASPDSAPLRLRKIEALLALHRFDEAAAELRSAGRPTSARARALALELDALQGNRPGDAEWLLNTPELPLADALYCRSLLTDDATQSLELLELAVRHDPRHYRAQIRRLATLYALGEPEKLRICAEAAELVWPEDYATHFFVAVARLMNNDSQEAWNSFRKAETLLGDDAGSLKLEFETLANFFNASYGSDDEPAVYAVDDGSVSEILSDFTEFMSDGAGDGGAISMKNWYHGLNQNAWRNAAETIHGALEYLEHPDRYQRENLLEWIQRLQEKRPRSAISPLHGVIAIIQADLAMQIGDHTDKISTAEPFFRDCANQPSVLPRLRLKGRMWAMEAARLMARLDPENSTTHLSRARNDLEIASNQFFLTRGDAQFLIDAAILLAEYPLARELTARFASDLNASNGNDEPARRYLMNIEFAAGHYVAAHMEAEHLLRQDDSDLEARTKSSESIAAAKHYVELHRAIVDP